MLEDRRTGRNENYLTFMFFKNGPINRDKERQNLQTLQNVQKMLEYRNSVFHVTLCLEMTSRFQYN